MTPTCQHCGSQVTARFARVYGDNDNEVFACLNCHSGNDLVSGAAAFEDYESEDEFRANYNQRTETAEEQRVPEVVARR